MNEKDLQKKIEQLEKISAFKSDVISISAHELRTSLTALRWINEMMLGDEIGKLSSEQKNFLEKQKLSIERMLALVQEMLTINHTETIGLTYQMKDTDITEVIEGVMFDFIGESHKKSIETIFVKPDKKIKKVKMDPDKIRVVLQNLIENAIKYSKEEGKVIVSVSADKDLAVISVKDNGIGIPDKEKNGIFGKFYRGEKAKKEHSFGTGLGLYMAKKIIEAHKGQITFESKDGIGTTFHFTLPLS